MKVAIAFPDNYQDSHQIYLEGMKGYPNPNCQPVINDSLAQFSLSLKDIYECGVTRVVNKLTVCNTNNHTIPKKNIINKIFSNISRGKKCIIIK